ncbi:collagen alpha-1(I) chain-like [Ursus maritimus]|uniref:Collagen alpha-1(I) chain-like n=1 Tax=Ursus maritimus TaxID=29073 RepID=A0A8M1F2P4_URSMA|nr:collagen alpha-1(I) chain-like [Ursus maritimus]
MKHMSWHRGVKLSHRRFARAAAVAAAAKEAREARPALRPGRPQQESSRAVPSAQAKPGAGSTLCTRRRRGDAKRTAPAERPGSRGGGRGACSLRLGARTLRLSGTGSGDEPGAKPLRAPLALHPGRPAWRRAAAACLRERLGPSADSSFAGAEIAKGSRRIGRSESPGLDELRTSGLSVPRASAGDLFAKWRWSRGGQCWNEAAPPAPTLLARGPGRGRGDTPCRRGRFSKPSYRKPSGSPGGDWLPAARNPLSGAGCQPSACPGVQPASPRAPGDRSAPAAASAAAAAAAGSGRGTRAEGERERTARERREGRKRVITRGRRGPARLQSSSGAVRHPGAGIAAKSEHAAARAAAVAAAAKEARGGSARSSAPGRPQARPSARTTSRLASSPAARELPRRAERPGEARRREHALHQTPGRGTPPSARLRRSARAAAAAGERGVFPAPRSPHAASQRDRERGRARREAPEGASGPSTRAGRPGDALQPACPCGSSLGARSARPPPRLPRRANFPGENPSGLSCGAAALSPGPQKLLRGRGRKGLRWSSVRPAALNPNPALSHSGGRCPGPSADSSFAGAEIAKGSRRIGRSESPGLDELRTSGLSVPRASAGDLFAKWRWSRGGQCWNEAAPPAPTLLARGPGRGRGDTPCRRGRFSKPSYRKPSGSPGGDWLPAARNPLSGAGCQPSACPGVQPASPRAPGDRSAPAAASAAAAAAAGSGRGTRAEGERERTARERREGRKRVITRGRRGPARLQSSSGAVRHPGAGIAAKSTRQPPALLLSPPQPRRLGSSARSSAPGRPRRASARTTSRLASSPAARELPRRAERPGEARRREHALHQTPGRGRQAHGSGGAPRQPRRRGGACSLRLGARTLRLSGTGSGDEPARSPEGASGPPPGPAGLATRCTACLRGWPRCALCAAASAPASARKLPAKTLRPLLRGRRALPGPRNCTPLPPQPRPTENMAPSNVVPRSPQGIEMPSPQNPPAPSERKLLSGPRKERAPLVQCEASGINQILLSRTRAGAAQVPSRQQFCWCRDCQGVVESAGLRVRDWTSSTSGLSVPRASAGDLFAKWRWSRGGQCWNEATRPRQLSWRGPAGAEGTLHAGGAAFQNPVTGTSGSPGGDTLVARNPLSQAPAASLFANRCAQSACPECSRRVPRAPATARSRSRLSRCRRRRWLARNKSRGRARAHGPRAPGGQGKRVITRDAAPRLQSSSGAVRHPGGPTRAPSGLYRAAWCWEGLRGEATRRPSCRGEKGAKSDPAPPELGLSYEEIREGGGDTASMEWGPWDRRALPRTTGHRGAVRRVSDQRTVAGCGVLP